MGPPLVDAARVEDRVDRDDADPEVDVLASLRAGLAVALAEVAGAAASDLCVRLCRWEPVTGAGAGVDARVDDGSA